MSRESTPQMNQPDQSYLDRLNQELEKVKASLAEVNPIDTTVTGDDIAEIQEIRDQQEQIVATYKERQKEIERALEWIKANGHVCAVCHQPITSARLEADPASITCKEHMDQEDSVMI